MAYFERIGTNWAIERDASTRRKLSAQIDSVVQKGLAYRLKRLLEEEHRLEEEALEHVIGLALAVVWQRAGGRAPNQLYLNVPAGTGPGSRRYATRQLKPVLLTPIDPEDLTIWYESGLGAMQRARLLRTLEETERQGGQFQLRELAALHNLTVNATKERLRPLREHGVRLAYHGRGHAQRRRERIGRLWFAVERLIAGQKPSEICDLCGLSARQLPEVARWWLDVVESMGTGTQIDRVAKRNGLAIREVEEAVELGKDGRETVRDLLQTAPQGGVIWPVKPLSVTNGSTSRGERLLGEFLHRRLGWSARRITSLSSQIRSFVSLYTTKRERDEVLYEAVSQDEPLGRPLRDCDVRTVRVRFATPEDGVGGERPTRITDVKRTKLARYATAAAEQGTFLTNADLCYLLGVHTDVVSRLLREPWALDVPTRQRAWEQRSSELAAVIAAAEKIAEGEEPSAAVGGMDLAADEANARLRTILEVARDVQGGMPIDRVAEAREQPRWLVERVSAHPSLGTMAGVDPARLG